VNSGLSLRVRALATLPGATAAVPFMAAACLLLFWAGLAVAAVSGLVAAGEWRSYPVLATNHLLTLGWGTLVALGALHQMFPALLGVSAKPGRAAAAHFALTAAGLLAVVLGLLATAPRWVATGGLVLVASALVFWAVLLRLIPRRRRWPPAATGVVLSSGYLLWTVSWGALMALNWNFQFWPALYTHLGLGVHAAVGLVGWFVQLVVAVSYYLLPRFTGVRGIPERRVVPLLWLLNASVALFVAAAVLGAPSAGRAGAFLLATAGGIYAFDLYRFLRGSRQQAPDLTNWHWWAIAAHTVVASAAGYLWAAGAWPTEGRRLAAAVAVLLLCGWVTLALMGQLYKVTPFLMWYYRYARGLSAYEVPRLSAPYFPRWGVGAFVLTAPAGTLLAASVLVGSVGLARVAGLLFAAGCAVYASGIAVSWILAVLVAPPRPDREAVRPG
jgi:hypothetical protein